MMKQERLITFSIIVSIIAVLLSIAAICLICTKNQFTFKFHASDLTDYLGLIISIFGVIATVYFVILGVHAHDLIKPTEDANRAIEQTQNEVIQSIENVKQDIQKTEQTQNGLNQRIETAEQVIKETELTQNEVIQRIKDTEQFSEETKQIQKEVKQCNIDLVNNSYMELSEQIALCKGNKNTKRYDRHVLLQARLAFNPYLDEEYRRKGLIRLCDLGEPQDCERLQKICDSPRESSQIKELARAAKEAIQKRTKQD